MFTVQASIYKEGGFGFPFVAKKKSKEPCVFRVRVKYMSRTDHFNTSALNSNSAKRNAVYRFCEKYLNLFDNRDFDKLDLSSRNIALQKMIKEVKANGKVNIVR